MPESSCTKVFISHNRKEKPWVRRIVAQWRQLGLDVFFDEDSVLPGEDVIHAIERGVSEADHIILVLSNASVENRWVAMETAMAMYGDPDGRERRVIPVLIEQVDPQKIRLGIRRLNMVDLSDESIKEQRYKHLLKSLGIPESKLLDPPRTDSTTNTGHLGTTLSAVGPESQQLRDRSVPDPVLPRILFFGMAAVVLVLLIAYWWGRTHYDTNTVYVFNLSGSVRSPPIDGNLLDESIEDLVQLIETNSTRPPYPEKSQVLMPTGSQPILCRMHASRRMKDLERLFMLTHFIDNCRKAVRAAPRQRTKRTETWLPSSLTLDLDADRGKTIIMFSDLAEDPAVVVAAGVDLHDACVAVIHIGPATNPLDSGSAVIRTNWEDRLVRWRTRSVRFWLLNEFDPDAVTDFVRDCISATN